MKTALAAALVALLPLSAQAQYPRSVGEWQAIYGGRASTPNVYDSPYSAPNIYNPSPIIPSSPLSFGSQPQPYQFQGPPAHLMPCVPGLGTRC